MNARPCLLLLTTMTLTSVVQADGLGRLFFSPSERNQLNQQALKQHGAEDSNNAAATITVNGIIKRSDGSRIAWVNGKQQEIAAHPNPNVVVVTIPSQNKPIEITVGERVMLDTQLPPIESLP